MKIENINNIKKVFNKKNFNNTESCPICNNLANQTYKGMKGYVEGEIFDIYECIKCEASFVNPLKSPLHAYEHIYNQVDKIPGYERYYRYSKLVKMFSQPLDILANSENVYWSVREALQNNFKDTVTVEQKKNIKILEVGSGLGYLSYSLNRAGYNAVGLDISVSAVAKAADSYGDFYEAGDLFDIAKSRAGKYDCVIMTELIEHVEDPVSFIKASLSLLNEGGKLIVTTPNKSNSPKDYEWGSDSPSVHLWWMSEKTLSTIADSLNKKYKFLDFTGYTSKYYEPIEFASIKDMEVGLPRIRQDGSIVHGTDDGILKKILGIRGRFIASYIRRRLKEKRVSSRTSTLCVVFY